MRQLGIGLSGGRSINPALLFASSEQGVWYDPSDFSTMFQDSAGTTPVTAVEQPVGLILDKSKGLVLGSELVTNGGFDSATGWNLVQPTSGIAEITGGQLTLTTNDGTIASAATTALSAFVVGKTYKVLIDGTRTSGDIKINIGGANLYLTTSGSKVFYFVATATSALITIIRNAAIPTSWVLDNISVRELPGQHSKQATAAARPVLRATPTRIDYDAVDDTLVATFASSLGTDCTVCRAVPSVGASILTAQTIGTTYTDNTDHCGLIIVNRSLTAAETASVTAYLNAKAGV